MTVGEGGRNALMGMTVGEVGRNAAGYFEEVFALQKA
jgi:hypothetical protein